MIMSSDECHMTLLLISQHWFRQWLGAVRQQAITWTSVDQDLQRHMASLGPNELSQWELVIQEIFGDLCANHDGPTQSNDDTQCRYFTIRTFIKASHWPGALTFAIFAIHRLLNMNWIDKQAIGCFRNCDILSIHSVCTFWGRKYINT